ncbi:MAG: sigma-70 family RNA polymerase sigma factor [Blastocatellia bacterium]
MISSTLLSNDQNTTINQLSNSQNTVTRKVETIELEKDNADIVKLIKLCCDDNKDAWDEFICRFHRYIKLCVIRTTQEYKIKSTDIAEIVQEVFLKLLADNRRILRDFRGNTQAAFLKYLSAIIYNLILDLVRKEISVKRFFSTVSLDTPTKDENKCLRDFLPASKEICHEQIIDEKITVQKIKQLLKTNFLGKNAVRDIKVFWLYNICDFSAREISELLEFSLTTSNIQVIALRTKEKLCQIVKQSISI